MKGNIVLIPFPFTNLKTLKRRPALILLERKKDIVVSFISSRIPHYVGKFHILVKKTHKEFNQSGLKVDSVIYLDKLATINKNLIIGELGEIGKKLKSRVNRNFKKIYHL